ncbi:MAG TPA: hypothetical protein DDZ51_14075 [Planctomycetaceae bacterium]|nr:hypothetical protein [Planctomycetaceae bacterium]
MHYLTAALVAACAGDAAAVFRWLTTHLATAKVYLAAGDAIVGAGAGAKAVTSHLAKILHCGTCHFVIGAAMNFETVGALFKPQLATRQHKKLVAYLGISNRRPKLRTTGIRRKGTLKQNSV